MAVTHGVSSATVIGAQDAERIARLMSALATASRVRILAVLRQAPRSVGELTEAVEMAQPAVSHQLRILRDLGLVTGTQAGRTTVYTLHDTHVAALLDEALRHIEHAHPHGHAADSHAHPHAHQAGLQDEHEHEHA